MTELCKFCVIFHRLYIDNIFKASKIKFSKYRSFFFGWCLFSFGHIYSDLKNAEEDRNRLINFSKPRGIIVKDELVCTVFGACPYILKKLNSPQKIDRFKTHVDWYMIDAWSRVAIVARLFSRFTNSDQRPWIDTLYTCFLHCTVFPCVRLMTKHLSYLDVRWAFPTNFSFPRNWSVWR